MTSNNSIKGIRNRTPLSKASNNNISTFEVVQDLSHLSLEELEARYYAIDEQSQMMKGLILLEARTRMASDKEFGKWVSSIKLSDSSTYQTRNAYMNLARFFKGRSMAGISLTVAYEISKPSNSDIAEAVYISVLDKNFSVSDAKQLINQKKAITVTDDNVSIEAITKIPTVSAPSEDENKIFNLISSLNVNSSDSAIALLKTCIKRIKTTPSVITFNIKK